MKSTGKQPSRRTDAPARQGSSARASERHAHPLQVRTTEDVIDLQHRIGNELTVQAITASREEENLERARRTFDAAERLFNARRYGAAAIRFERVRQTPGLSAEVYSHSLFNLAVCNLRLERFATATMYLEQAQAAGIPAREIEPLLRQAREATAADAERIMNRAGGSLPGASSDPAAQTSGAQAVFEQAVAEFAEGHLRQSIILFEQVREMELSENAEEIRQACLRNIGRANMQLGRHATAIVYLEQAIDVTTGSAERATLESWLATCLQRTGALTTVDQAQLMYRMANQAFSAGDHRTALDRFRVVLTIRGLDQQVIDDTRYNMGLCHFLMGELEAARSYIAPYVEAHPDDAEARERLDQINDQVPAG